MGVGFQVIGVAQVINKKNGEPFTKADEEVATRETPYNIIMVILSDRLSMDRSFKCL